MSGEDRRLSHAWLVLILLTLAGSAIAEGVSAHRLAIAAIFILAAIKGQLVAIHFMEVRHAAPHWHALYRIWVVLIAAMLAVGNLIA